MAAIVAAAPRAGDRAEASARATCLERAPLAVRQRLDRTEARLVSHLRALRDPVAEVEMRQTEPAAGLDLPQDAVGAERSGGQIGLVEGVDARQAVGETVDHADHAQY